MDNLPTLCVDDPESTIDDEGPVPEAIAAKLGTALVNYLHAVLLTGVRPGKPGRDTLYSRACTGHH